MITTYLGPQSRCCLYTWSRGVVEVYSMKTHTYPQSDMICRAMICRASEIKAFWKIQVGYVNFMYVQPPPFARVHMLLWTLIPQHIYNFRYGFWSQTSEYMNPLGLGGFRGLGHDYRSAGILPHAQLRRAGRQRGLSPSATREQRVNFVAVGETRHPQTELTNVRLVPSCRPGQDPSFVHRAESLRENKFSPPAGFSHGNSCCAKLAHLIKHPG